MQSQSGQYNFNLKDLGQEHRVQLHHYIKKCLEKNLKNAKRKEKDKIRREEKKATPKAAEPLPPSSVSQYSANSGS